MGEVVRVHLIVERQIANDLLKVGIIEIGIIVAWIISVIGLRRRVIVQRKVAPLGQDIVCWSMGVEEVALLRTSISPVKWRYHPE